MTLGECINNYLDEHDMSMRKFAALAGVSHAYISNIVNGKTSRGNDPVPTLKVYKGIAKAMGIEVNELLSTIEGKIDIRDEKTPVTESNGNNKDIFLEKKMELANSLFSTLSPEDQDFAIDFLKKLSHHQ